MSLFKQILEDDLKNVFLNTDEFAETHEIQGKTIGCIVDEQAGMAETASLDGFANVAGIGVLHADQTVYCRADDLEPRPLPGEKIVMDGKFWIVADGVSESGGLLTLPLNRNY